eukprot:COSAG02_NODE_923_length_15877_cov_26.660920_3_plen_84_part_00
MNTGYPPENHAFWDSFTTTHHRTHDFRTALRPRSTTAPEILLDTRTCTHPVLGIRTFTSCSYLARYGNELTTCEGDAHAWCHD